MTGLLICAAVVALVSTDLCWRAGAHYATKGEHAAWASLILGLALIAVALWLAYEAGGA